MNIQVVGVDNKHHVAFPHSDKCLCGVTIKEKKPHNFNHRLFWCYECSSIDDIQDITDTEWMLEKGTEVRKRSNKPFKSGELTGIITGFYINKHDPKQRMAYEIDDDTCVNIDRCVQV